VMVSNSFVIAFNAPNTLKRCRPDVGRQNQQKRLNHFLALGYLPK
jgi:hypothetical protein